MNEEVFSRKKVSFTGYLNKDGQIIKTIGFTLMGEVLILNIDQLSTGMKKLPLYSCTDGELYFVPCDSLIFSKE